jgi:hypothetical protein
MSHPTDEALAALNDGAVVEERAATMRAHLEGCADCRRRCAELEAAAARVASLPPPQPSLAVEVLEAIEAERAPPGGAWLRPAGWLSVGVAAGVAAMLVIAPAPPAIAPPTGALTARGVADGVSSSTGLKLHPEVLTNEGWQPVAGRAYVRASDGRPSLRVAVDVLAPPKTPSFLVAYARDADGAVTWLRPSWTDAEQVPRAEPSPTAVGPGPAPEHVTLDRPATVLEVTVAELGASVGLDVLDAVLERGGELSEGPVTVRHVRRHWLRVRDDGPQAAASP